MTRGTIISAAVIGALLGLNWYIAERPIEVGPIAPAATITEAATSDAGQHDVTASDDPSANDQNSSDLAFQERPLFSPTRRPREPHENVANNIDPPASNTAEHAAASAEPSGLRLIGVMQLGGRERRALIRAVSATNGIWLALGGEVDGWRISSIEPETVVIAKSGGSERLVLRRRPVDDTR